MFTPCKTAALAGLAPCARNARTHFERMRRPLPNDSRPGQAVYEPFGGSGTTIIAAETTGRACHAVELSPAYVDVAVQRWQAFTGERAVLDGSATGFAEAGAQRRGPRE
jgi:hypothetical protein